MCYSPGSSIVTKEVGVIYQRQALLSLEYLGTYPPALVDSWILQGYISTTLYLLRCFTSACEAVLLQATGCKWVSP